MLSEFLFLVSVKTDSIDEGVSGSFANVRKQGGKKK